MATPAIEFHRRWIEQCEATQRIKLQFGLSSALEYLVGEKLLHYVEAAEHHPEFAQELPYFIAAIKRVFSLAEIGNYAVHIERTQPLSASQRAAIRAISSVSGQIHEESDVVARAIISDGAIRNIQFSRERSSIGPVKVKRPHITSS